MKRAWFEENPFRILDVATTASRMECHRKASKLIAQLELGAKSARSYRSALGERERSEELVRWAEKELTDPIKRIVYAWFAEHPLRDPRQDRAHDHERVAERAASASAPNADNVAPTPFPFGNFRTWL